jgi:hypothetical protein
MSEHNESDALLSGHVAPPRGLAKIGLIAGGVAVLVVAWGLVSRNHADVSAQSFADAQSVPTVHLVAPGKAGSSTQLVLPGTMQAWTSARIFPRVSGYVRSWDKDIGAMVGSGTRSAISTRPNSTSRSFRPAPPCSAPRRRPRWPSRPPRAGTIC